MREEEEKDHFYEELQQTIDGYNRNDILVVIGDFNAKVGGDKDGYERCMGRHGMGDKNDNGDRLCDFSMANCLVITGTLFQYKDIHNATWVSANGRVKNQIDHLLISRQLRSAVLDARAHRVADINSDHYLVRTKDLDQEKAQSSRSSSYATSWSKSTSGMLPCTFISLTWRRRLTRRQRQPVDDHERVRDSRQADA